MLNTPLIIIILFTKNKINFKNILTKVKLIIFPRCKILKLEPHLLHSNNNNNNKPTSKRLRLLLLTVDNPTKHKTSTPLFENKSGYKPPCPLINPNNNNKIKNNPCNIHNEWVNSAKNKIGYNEWEFSSKKNNKIGCKIWEYNTIIATREYSIDWSPLPQCKTMKLRALAIIKLKYISNIILAKYRTW